MKEQSANYTNKTSKDIIVKNPLNSSLTTNNIPNKIHKNSIRLDSVVQDFDSQKNSDNIKLKKLEINFHNTNINYFNQTTNPKKDYENI